MDKLHTLVENGDVPGVEKLLTTLRADAKDVCSKEQTRNGTVVHLASRLGDIEILRLVLDTGVNLNRRTSEGLVVSGLSALHEAVVGEHIEVVNFLLGRAADVNIKEHSGQTPLHMACQRDRTDIVELLVCRGADVNIRDDAGQSPLQVSILRAPEETSIFLIQNGADIHIVDQEGQTPLHYASDWGSEDVIKHLIKAGAKVNLQDKAGQSSLHLAAEESTFDLLVENGGDQNLRDKRGKPPKRSRLDMEKDEYQNINMALSGHTSKAKNRLHNPTRSHVTATRTFSPGPPIPETELKTARSNMLKELMAKKGGMPDPTSPRSRATMVKSPLARDEFGDFTNKLAATSLHD